PLEVGWDGENRYTPVLRIKEPAQPSVLKLKDGMKVLVTGGGSGITAEIIKDLANKTKLELHIIDIADFDKSEQAQGIVQELKNRNAKVKYFNLDVLNFNGLKKIVDENGPYRGIIHGAGIDRSKLITEKSQEEFNLIYDVKVKGAFNLLTATKNNPIEFFLTFSSVSGRFGNRGQTDYSAANDTINKIHGPIKKIHPKCVVKTIGWSAWAETGMASKGTTKTVLSAAGVTFIPINKGVALAFNELTNGYEKEVYYSGSLGPLDKEGIMKWEEGIHSTDYLKITSIKSISPLIDEVLEQKNDFIIVKRVFDGKREKFLPDHKIFGKMVVPGVMGLEMFAEVANILIPNKKILAFEDVEFKNPIGVDGPIEVKIEGKVIERGDIDRIRFIITSEVEVKGIKKLQENFIGTIALGDKITKKSKKSLKDIIQGIPIKKEIQREAIYKILFHGETFKVIDSITLFENDETISNYYPIKQSLLDSNTGFKDKDLLTSPLQCESAFQAAGIYVLDQHKMMALPFTTRLIEIQKKIDIQEKVIIYSKFKERKENTFILDLEIFDLQGNPIISIKDFEMKGYMKLEEKFEKANNIPYEEIKTSWDKPRIFRLRIDSLDDNLDYYKQFFSKDEWDLLFTEKMIEKRKKEHLAGRLIAKCAIALKEKTEQGLAVKLEEINIITVKTGKPYGQLNNNKYNLSISHSNDWAIASISDEEHGADIELIEKRDSSFQKESFTQEELKKLETSIKKLKLTNDEAITLLFSSKEALFKKLGLGLKGGLKKVNLTDIEKIIHRSKDRINDFKIKLNYESQSYGIMTMILDDYVISVTK
ncbi:MAG: SDR family NAD(P)-dependent oxidoreductase, partial [Asgard group archaeon]|nr:SDR family NAD(P)-dependent oxidoreductase [Asgard group archaeon]